MSTAEFSNPLLLSPEEWLNYSCIEASEWNRDMCNEINGGQLSDLQFLEYNELSPMSLYAYTLEAHTSIIIRYSDFNPNVNREVIVEPGKSYLLVCTCNEEIIISCQTNETHTEISDYERKVAVVRVITLISKEYLKQFPIILRTKRPLVLILRKDTEATIKFLPPEYNLTTENRLELDKSISVPLKEESKVCITNAMGVYYFNTDGLVANESMIEFIFKDGVETKILQSMGLAPGSEKEKTLTEIHETPRTSTSTSTLPLTTNDSIYTEVNSLPLTEPTSSEWTHPNFKHPSKLSKTGWDKYVKEEAQEWIADMCTGENAYLTNRQFREISGYRNNLKDMTLYAFLIKANESRAMSLESSINKDQRVIEVEPGRSYLVICAQDEFIVFECRRQVPKPKIVHYDKKEALTRVIAVDSYEKIKDLIIVHRTHREITVVLKNKTSTGFICFPPNYRFTPEDTRNADYIKVSVKKTSVTSKHKITASERGVLFKKKLIEVNFSDHKTHLNSNCYFTFVAFDVLKENQLQSQPLIDISSSASSTFLFQPEQDTTKRLIKKQKTETTTTKQDTNKYEREIVPSLQQKLPAKQFDEEKSQDQSVIELPQVNNEEDPEIENFIVNLFAQQTQDKYKENNLETLLETGESKNDKFDSSLIINQQIDKEGLTSISETQNQENGYIEIDFLRNLDDPTDSTSQQTSTGEKYMNPEVLSKNGTEQTPEEIDYNALLLEDLENLDERLKKDNIDFDLFN